MEGQSVHERAIAMSAGACAVISLKERNIEVNIWTYVAVAKLAVMLVMRSMTNSFLRYE